MEAETGRSGRLGGVAGLVVCACALLIIVRPVHAQASPTIELRQFGWQADGTIAGRHWNPVLVRVTAPESGNSEVVRVQATLSLGTVQARTTQQTYTAVATYGQEVALPRGGLRDVKLWVPLEVDGPYLLTVQVLGSSGEVLAEQSATSQSVRSDLPLVATLSDSPVLAAQINRIDLSYQQGLTAKLRPVDLGVADVPARADYLSAFQALVVQGGSAASLTGEQKRAIQDWVGQGGHLLIVGGPDAARAASVLDGADALGVRFAGIDAAVDFQPLSDWTAFAPEDRVGIGAAARIEASSGEPLAGPPNRPLVARSSWGDGSVTLLAADPSLDPLRGWSGTPSLLKRTLEPALSSQPSPDPRSGLAAFQARSDDAHLLNAVDALPSDAFPDWQHVALVLGGFAFVAGPLLHLVLWRTDRRAWLWIAVPLLSLAATASIYAINAAQPGHDVIANAIAELRLDPRSGEAHQAIAVGYFAPLRDQLSVHLTGEVPVRVSLNVAQSSVQSYTSGAYPLRSGGFVLLPGASAAGVSFGVSGLALDPGYRVTTGRDTQIDFKPNPYLAAGGLRSMVFSRTLAQATFGQIESDLRIEGPDGLIQGTIRNATPYPLDQVGLAIGQTVAKLGPMAPGQTTSVSFDPRVPPPTAPGGVPYSYAWQLFGIPGATAMLDLPGDPDVRRRVRVLDTIFGGGDRNGNAAYGLAGLPVQGANPVRPMLVALSSASIGADVLPTVGAQRSFQLTVLEVPVRFEIATGPFTIVPSLVRPAITLDLGASLNASGGYASAGQKNVLLDLRGTATYTYRPDLPASARVDRLVLTTQQTLSSTPAPPGGAPPAPTLPASPGPSMDGTFSIYNWQTSGWQPIAGGKPETVFNPPTGMLAPDGTVRVRVTSGGTDKTVRFVPPELTLSGEATP